MSQDDRGGAVGKVSHHFVAWGKAEITWLHISRILLGDLQSGFGGVGDAQMRCKLVVQLYRDNARASIHERARQNPQSRTHLKYVIDLADGCRLDDAIDDAWFDEEVLPHRLGWHDSRILEEQLPILSGVGTWHFFLGRCRSCSFQRSRSRTQASP
ncbi:MAG: hypothetical protein M3346_09200, partial [Actinomycetota bacterium]|nr:hypothetical protein [Actinomycetota bacterium]